MDIGFTAADAVSRGCVATLALLLFGLSAAVTATRLRTRMLVGAPADPSSLLAKLVRAQGNTAEYAGLLCVLILAAGAQPRPGWVTALMLLAVASRVVFAIGMLTCESLARLNIVRGVGAAGTYVAGFGLAAALLVG